MELIVKWTLLRRLGLESRSSRKDGRFLDPKLEQATLLCKDALHFELTLILWKYVIVILFAPGHLKGLPNKDAHSACEQKGLFPVFAESPSERRICHGGQPEQQLRLTFMVSRSQTLKTKSIVEEEMSPIPPLEPKDSGTLFVGSDCLFISGILV